MSTKSKSTKQSKASKARTGKTAQALAAALGADAKAEATSKKTKAILADKAVKAAKAKAGVPMKPAKRETVGDYACELLTKEADVQKVLEAVLKKFPTAKTSVKCIYWYRSRMNRGML